ncbi:MAG: hypothetical protein Q8K58_09260 [Acidimicrobiales bacterium]|nr:hypothetical protein [Acidimicrobiales bacterium]
MVTYALLPKASANRVYGAASFQLLRAELDVLDRLVLGSVVVAQDRRSLGGIEYVAVDCGRERLDGRQRRLVSNLSSLHALFELDDDLLRPVDVEPLRRQDDDIVTIQRYAGKTNEAFTHLLVNLALAAAGDAFPRLLAGERVRLLDPACGRGTTLNRALVYGMDAVGMDVDRHDLEAYEAFLLAWLQDKRLKHHAERARLRKGRDEPAHRCTVTYGATKDQSAQRVVDVVHDDAAAARTHLRARSIDVLACDLPYGVQHAARSAEGAVQRGPHELLEAALPVWFEVLRPGAGAALAWNLRTLPRSRLVHLLETHGFELLVPAADERFAHRVDRAITRDVVTARRPR